jgi:two-component system chemotaxis response regulator CheB
MAVEFVAIGVSLGGLTALHTLLAGLSTGLPYPVAIVQHRSPMAGDLLAQLLRRDTPHRVREPMDKEPVEGGTVYLAPPDYHLLVEDGTFALSTEGVVTYARPSIDVLFESVAEEYGECAVGVVLTGANADGAAGAARIKARGGLVIVQDPDTAECPVMPRSVMQVVKPDFILPLEEIGPCLSQLHARGLPAREITPESEHPHWKIP